MEESTILDILKSIANRLDTVAAMSLATFMLVAVILLYVILVYNKQ